MCSFVMRLCGTVGRMLTTADSSHTYACMACGGGGAPGALCQARAPSHASLFHTAAIHIALLQGGGALRYSAVDMAWLCATIVKRLPSPAVAGAGFLANPTERSFPDAGLQGEGRDERVSDGRWNWAGGAEAGRTVDLCGSRGRAAGRVTGRAR